jgi:hemoglobin
MYERVGGDEFFETLTRRFYNSVASDPVLRAVYPDDPDEFDAARRHLKLFLVQFWGGPPVYRDERGEPMLRMRHAPFRIGPAERDAWLKHMTDAVTAAGLSALDETQMLSYFNRSAAHMVNAE